MTTPTNGTELYALLPEVHRIRDARLGYPLRALLELVEEQVDLVRGDILALYDDLFIDTCTDAVIPYIGDLLAYQSPFPPQADLDPDQAAPLLPLMRRDVADTVHNRRRKGTPGVLVQLADDIAGWPARVIETIRHTNPENPDTEHALAVVELQVWPLHPRPITAFPPDRLDEAPERFRFSALGNDVALMTRPDPAPGLHAYDPTAFPGFLTRHELRAAPTAYLGDGRSIRIWRLDGPDRTEILPEAIAVADLSDWDYRCRRHEVVIDPERGRFAFHEDDPPDDVIVSYAVGAAQDIGGGEYIRPMTPIAGRTVYRVGTDPDLTTLADALHRWDTDRASHPRMDALIELPGGVYEDPLPRITLRDRDRLEIRAKQESTVLIRLLNQHLSRADGLDISGPNPDQDTPEDPTARVVLDGLQILGRPVRIDGALHSAALRHCTLVPGWELDADSHPRHGERPSLVVQTSARRVDVNSSVIGSVTVRGRPDQDPIDLTTSRSVIDATNHETDAISGPEDRVADAILTMNDTELIGRVRCDAIKEATDCTFTGTLDVEHRQTGSLRRCTLPADSRTPVLEQPTISSAPIPSTRYGHQPTTTPTEEQTRLADVLRSRLNEFSPASIVPTLHPINDREAATQ